jgi:hypothetical protein
MQKAVTVLRETASNPPDCGGLGENLVYCSCAGNKRFRRLFTDRPLAAIPQWPAMWRAMAAPPQGTGDRVVGNIKNRHWQERRAIMVKGRHWGNLRLAFFARAHKNK